jgi:outer membrane phospholipase A
MMTPRFSGGWPSYDFSMDIWIAYTQRSFWQFYNFADSAPFHETDFEPELLLNVRTKYRFLGFRGCFNNAGLNHQSNGRAEPLSRSWIRVVANFGFKVEAGPKWTGGSTKRAAHRGGG